jgi:hypothetical protein
VYDADRYLRWIQFCAWGNIMRVHSDPYNDRRPWMLGEFVESTFRQLVKTRIALVPQLASAAQQASVDATPLVQRLDAEWPRMTEATRMDQFLFLVDTLVAPIDPFPPPPPPSPSPPRPRGFDAQPCVPGKASQLWLLSPGVSPGDAASTVIRSAAGSTGGCWEITGCSSAAGAAIGCGYGCKPLPKPGSAPGKCDLNGAWAVHSNGTITSVMDGHCVEAQPSAGAVPEGSRMAVVVGPCTGRANQQFKMTPSKSNGSSGYTVQQNGLCVDNEYGPTHQTDAASPVYNRSRSVFIPPGKWTHGYTGETITGPTTIQVTNVSLDQMPLFHRRGGIVVTAWPSRNAATLDWSRLVVQWWPGSALSVGEGSLRTFFVADGDTTWRHDLRMVVQRQGGGLHSDDRCADLVLEIGRPQLHFAPVGGGGDPVAIERAWHLRVHVPVSESVIAVSSSGSAYPHRIHPQWRDSPAQNTPLTGFGVGPSSISDVLEITVAPRRNGSTWPLSFALSLCRT